MRENVPNATEHTSVDRKMNQKRGKTSAMKVRVQAETSTAGTGELFMPISPTLLFSLPPLLLLLSALLWLFDVVELFKGPSPLSAFVFGARQEGISQVTPVKVLS